MSVLIQTSFLPSFQEELRRSLSIFQTSGVRHHFFQKFVRSLAVSYKSSKPGATIVAACPGGLTCDEVISTLHSEISELEKSNYQSPSDFRVVEISAPARFTHRQLEAELVARYTSQLNSVSICHRTQPRFEDAHFSNYNALTCIGRLISFLKTKSPSLVVIREAENLKWPGASDAETRAAWRLIVDIARQSEIPHLLFAPVSVVKSVVCDDPTMLGEMHVEVLKPYQRTEGGQWECFDGVLYDFDQVMPWTEGECLTNRIDEIDEAVAGDIDRLRQWVLRALNNALMEPDTGRISWCHFRETKPQCRQRVLARTERDAALALLEPKDKWAEAEKAAKANGESAAQARNTPATVVEMPKAKSEPQSPTLKPLKPGDRARGRDAILGTEFEP